MTEGSTVPKFIEDAAFSGAGEGNRNDRAFWLAAQCRDSRLSPGDAANLIDIFARRCNPPLSEREARQALASAYRSAPREPPASKQGLARERVARPPRADSDEVIPFDGEIGRHRGTDGVGAPDYVDDVPAPSGDPVADLRAWLAALFQPDDKVNYVVSSFKDEDGRHKPRGLGVNRTRSDIEADLDRYAKKGHTGEALLRYVLGDWDGEAGVWARINPMDGQGSTNGNVARLDHVLVEGDEQAIGKQLAVIRSLRLPCSAVVHSGGKSVHAVVRIGAGADKALYAERVGLLFKALEDAGFKPDVKCRNSSRLSRLPGPSRAGKPQYLVSGPCGAPSWDAWQSEREESEFQTELLGFDALMATPPEDNLVGNRFLCRGGSWLVSAQSGIGKSVLAIQGAISFAVGRDLFGLRPTGPLKNLIVQAENNRGDMHAAFSGVVNGLNLGPGELRDMDAHFRTVHCSRYAGAKFVEFLAHLCRSWRPDVVWIDPLLAFFGGEISKMSDCREFLRNLLNPVVEDFAIGVVVVHHMPKPPKKAEDGKYKGYDLSYAGIGSSDITNWARATSTVVRVQGCDNRFRLEHAKRAELCGCPAVADIMHGAGSDICWYPAPGAVRTSDAAPDRQKQAAKRRSRYDGIGLETMAPASAEWKDEKHTASEAADRVSELVSGFGIDCTVKAAAILLKNNRLADFLEYDKESKTWRGRLYDPEF